MVYVYKEKNNTGIGPCGCTNSPTRAFCQSNLAAEMAQDGTIIYRGEPLFQNRISGSVFGSYNLYPPLRNEGGYDNANGLGLYDNVNKSIGHRVPCNLRLEISNATNLNWCNDCEDLNGTYDSVPVFSSLAAHDSILGYQGTMWFWPLCNSYKIGNSCGASHVCAYLAFDENDGFNTSTDTVRDVFLNIGIITHPIDYNPTVGPYSFALDRIYSTGFQHLIKKRVKVGEKKYKKFTASNKSYGYYDSNVDAASWTGLEITDSVYLREYCSATFKVTSMNDDDLVGLKRSIGYQNCTGYVGNQHGLSYARCQTDERVLPPSDAYYGDLTSPPNLEIETDAEWNITRVYQKLPHFWKVTVAGATGKAEPINGEHYLFIYDDDLYIGANSIEKVLYPYDSNVKPEGSYGDYDKVACSPCGQADPCDVCLYDMSLSLNNGENDMVFDFYLYGGSNLTWRYRGTVSQSSNRGWITSPASLTYLAYGGIYEGTDVCDLRNLTVTVENGNTWSEVNQVACYPVPRNSHCAGGKEPDAFLVELDGSWDAGYMNAFRAVHWSSGYAVNYGFPYATCFGCNSYGSGGGGYCEPAGGPYGNPQYPSPTLKVIDDCWMCGNDDWQSTPSAGHSGVGCFTNCESQTWEGPVGSFMLTKVQSTNPITNGNTGCYNANECNNTDPMITYSYKNGTIDTVCNWTGLTMKFGLNNCITAPASSISIALSASWGAYNSAGEPDKTYCAEQTFHADTCQNQPYSTACTQMCSLTQDQDFNGCVQSSQLNCPYQSCGGGVIQDPSAPDVPQTIQFTLNIPKQRFENHVFIECNDPAGFDLVITNPEPTDDYAHIYFCRDDVLAAPPLPPNIPVHASFTGTARATPIYY